eukprot:gnl/MRDRNA2_/MRDRNA2_149744_c0_seq1.p1 gnl/MRDRNA2_/MRDRNA2_149744_c0~~gnl/MRDRNA2_/MRDRNA2_149744_c0_seq1.p1  ORF type:complete len:133 (-),score=23.77 gnl/MRDRNA2_/MRDRNA2_149744_c0_seq1:127-525(-)
MASSMRRRRCCPVIALLMISMVQENGIATKTTESSIHSLRRFAPQSESLHLTNEGMKNVRPRGGRGEPSEPLPVQEKRYNEEVHPKETAWLWDIKPPLWLLLVGPILLVAMVSCCCCYGSYLWKKKKSEQEG